MVTAQKTTKMVAEDCGDLPHSLEILHQLTEDDPGRILQFCETITDHITCNAGYISCTCCSDECIFNSLEQ